MQEFIFEFVVSLATRSKPKLRNAYYVASSQQRMKAQAVVDRFCEYLESKGVETRSLTSSKDYSLIVNGLWIGREFVDSFLGQAPASGGEVVGSVGKEGDL